MSMYLKCPHQLYLEGGFFADVVRGKTFGPDHEMWGMLKEGDVICVYALVNGKWKNVLHSGRLMMYEKFDPTRILKVHHN